MAASPVCLWLSETAIGEEEPSCDWRGGREAAHPRGSRQALGVPGRAGELPASPPHTLPGPGLLPLASGPLTLACGSLRAVRMAGQDGQAWPQEAALCAPIPVSGACSEQLSQAPLAGTKPAVNVMSFKLKPFVFFIGVITVKQP